jgi:rare lipoprotein A
VHPLISVRHRRASVAAVVLAIAALAAACGAPAKRGGTRPDAAAVGPVQHVQQVQHGMASWYGGRHHGGKTASGERFDKHAMTAAHPSFKMNTRVRVTNQRNGRSVIVRINDRGPRARGRIIDVSEEAAAALGMKQAGVVPVKVERLR